jgi:spore maturation protein CgeB
VARPLYCAVDADLYQPRPARRPRWHLGYMGTYSADRQPALERLLLEPARRCPAARMVVAGAQYPRAIRWPGNVQRIEHVAPAGHAAFYGRQRFTLNLTRASMIEAGYSPSVRLFEAAACGCPIISDWWEGLDTFFTPGEEILLADDPERVAEYVFDLPEAARAALGRKARTRILAAHTAAARALELEGYALQLLGGKRPAAQAARGAAAAASLE